jgi:hypothetical protein
MKPGNKILIILGAAFVFFAACVVVGIVFVATKGHTLDKESKQYANTAARAIVSQWDITEIQQRASPEFKSVVKDDDLEKLVKMFRRLGNLKTYSEARGSSNISFTTQHGKLITATYVAAADFDSGPAEIWLSLIKHGDKWQLAGIKINSKVFLEQP